MNRDQWREIFEAVREGALSPEEALSRVAHLPYEDLGFARIDHHRLLRRGFPEAIFGEGKTAAEVARILRAFEERAVPALVTRLDGAKARAVKRAVPEFAYHPRSRLGYLGPAPGEGVGGVVVVSGGSSDAPVAEEAYLTARYLGARTELHPDVGVAGLHRVASILPSLQRARVVVAVAGMEGALPSVVAGLTGALVIGVPTSIGYGVQDFGKTPLFAMLASCVPGLVVVNVDAGFSAGYAAAVINRAAETSSKRTSGAGRKSSRRPE